MTFTAAVATGPEATESLRRLVAAGAAPGGTAVVGHTDFAVAWAAESPWVDSHDDGDVLVVVDGRLHDPASPASGAAEQLYERYRTRGAHVAVGLLGDFVIVVLDRARRRTLVARDPLGVRPWYQATAGRRHAGASEMATLAALPWVDTAVNEDLAIEYLAPVWESRGETLHRGIGTLRPGHTWHSNGKATRTFAHHRWEFAPDLEISWDDAAERCREVLGAAVASRLHADVPATSELSGGLDSSSVVGTIMRLGREDLLVGRLIFEGPRADERSYSDAVIDHWGLPAVSAAPWMPTEQEAEELTRQLRRPLPDPHFMMFASLHRTLLTEGRTESLTGAGGDDAFAVGGIGGRIVSAVKLRQGDVLAGLARRAIHIPRDVWPGMLRPALHHLARWRGDALPPWVRREAAARADLPRLFRRRPERVTGIDAIDERIANISSGYDACILETSALVQDLVGRRLSHPFLDPRFVQATYGLDPWWPARDGHTRRLEVDAFSDRLPAAVAQRQSKADFSEVFWPQLLTGETVERVRGGPLHDLGWLDREGFDAMVVRAKKGMANAAIPLSRCVALDRWMRTQ
jgi:asparagine synthetase B (glutamine-hydrolysing)